MIQKKSTEPETTFKELRTELRKTVFKEFKTLTDTLSILEPKERIDLLVKLMPFALPKCENMSATFNEKDNFILE